MITCKFDDGGTGNLRHVCVDAIVYVEDKILLVKRSSKLSSAPGKYCLPGGYLDRDEFLTEGVVREVKEETGYAIENPTLFEIRDYPGDVGDLDRQNIVFRYIVKNATKVTDAIDWDSEESIWVPLDSLEKMKDLLAFDHYKVLQAFISYQKNIVDLPIINAYLNY
ncbi:MAG: NUDIX hydrolase [Patescibacteria group bacterium]